MVNREVIDYIDYFNRASTLTTTPTQNGWCIKDTSSGGTPTYAVATTADGGGMTLTLDSTSEAEVVTMYHNDILWLDLRTVQFMEIIAKVSGVDAVTTIVAGLASAQNDTADSVATNVWFRMQGSVSTSNIVVETDDASTDNDDVATGATLAAVYKTFRIDFTSANVPATGTTNLTNIRFSVDGSSVATGTTFSMAGLTAGLNVQPFFQLQKGSGTGIPAITIKKVHIRYTEANGA